MSTETPTEDPVDDVLLWVMQQQANDASYRHELMDKWLTEKDATIADLQAEVKRLQPFEDAVIALEVAMARWEPGA